MSKKRETILLHLPSYRDPEIIPTIEDAMKQATHPERVHFGICRQYHPEDGFDDLTKYKNDSRFKIYECLYTEAKGLPWARSVINEQLLTDEDFVCQLDSHHRFAEGWDETLIGMIKTLEGRGYKKPIVTGYSPLYTPFNDPAGRSTEPWQSQFVCFYPHGTIFIRPGLLHGYQNMGETEYPQARFLCGHFDFARSEWAREIKHDTDIYFSGEEINLTVRSYTAGYDFFHPNRIVVWHSTMREERAGMLKWDDDAKLGTDWWGKQEYARKKIRCLFGTDEGIDLGEYGLGTERTLRDYEKFAGVNFKRKAVQKYTLDNQYPPNPPIEDEELWEKSFMESFYYLVNVERKDFPRNNYKHILVAFDDENGIAVNQKYITGPDLDSFINNGRPIHYEEYFLTDRTPKRVVYWAYAIEDGWVERVEHQI